MKPVFDCISTHSAEIIAVGKGASLAHLSESRFSRIFKQISGMKFVNYVDGLRLLEQVGSPYVRLNYDAGNTVSIGRVSSTVQSRGQLRVAD